MPATNPDVLSRTWNVWLIDVIVPDSHERSALAEARSAALTPPGSCAAFSCTLGGAAALKPNATDGNRPSKSYESTRICCRFPPNCSSCRPCCHDPLSLYWKVCVVRPCGWKLSTG